MILNDIIADYQFVDSKLKECEEYFTKYQSIIDGYFENTSSAAAKFFSIGSNETTRNNYINEMKEAMAKCFTLITNCTFIL